MRDRTVLILEIINNPCPDSLVIEELAEYGPDTDAPLAMVTREDLISMLQQFQAQAFGAYDLKAWAIRLLGRRDIEFEFGQEGAVVDALFWLAYEDIGEGDHNRVFQRIDSMLERRRHPRDD